MCSQGIHAPTMWTAALCQMWALTAYLLMPTSASACFDRQVVGLTQAAEDAKVKSHPVQLDSRPSGGNSSPALSSAVSAADSTVWDADPDEAQQPALASQRSNSGGPSSPWGGPDRPAASRDSTGPSFVRSRLAAASSAVAEPSEDDRLPETEAPVAQRRLTWLGILLEALLLFGTIAAFLVLEMLKARREICTWQFGVLYGIQVSTFLCAPCDDIRPLAGILSEWQLEQACL